MSSPATKRNERVSLFEAARRMPSSVLVSPTPLPRRTSTRSAKGARSKEGKAPSPRSAAMDAAKVLVGGLPVPDAEQRAVRLAKLLDELVEHTR